jgi:hypothetical protein
MSKEHNVGAVARQFQIFGEFVDAKPYGSGHINDTYCTVFHQAGVPVRYILQRINHHVFKNPVALMENIQRVTSHLGAQVAGEPDFSRRVLTLIPAHDGRPWQVDANGNYWRAYLFIERARTYDAVESTEQAFQAVCKVSETAGRPARAAVARYYPGLSPHAETVYGVGAGNRPGRGWPRDPGKSGN